jgi:hypothetical protein
MMGAKVGILDADIYGPSLPTMTSPDPAVLEMDAETRAIKPCVYEGTDARQAHHRLGQQLYCGSAEHELHRAAPAAPPGRRLLGDAASTRTPS